MDRRRFIGAVGGGILALGLAGCGMNFPWKAGNRDDAGAQNTLKPATTVSGYDKEKLIISEGAEPELLMEKGLQAIGGISALVHKGSTVVIKPNFSVPRKPEEAATTDPLLVAALVKQCLAVGAKEVKVIDYPFTSAPVCLENSGIKKAVEAAGGKVFVTNTQNFYTSVDIGGKVLQTALFSKDVLAADVLINFPKLKHHNITKITMGLKNMMGLVWDRGYFHKTDLNQTIAELAAFCKPNLTILDATRGITDNGPVGPGTIREWNQVVFGVDPVAVDAYGAELFGLKPAEIAYLSSAAQLGVGNIDVKKLAIVKV